MDDSRHFPPSRFSPQGPLAYISVAWLGVKMEWMTEIFVSWFVFLAFFRFIADLIGSDAPEAKGFFGMNELWILFGLFFSGFEDSFKIFSTKQKIFPIFSHKSLHPWTTAKPVPINLPLLKATPFLLIINHKSHQEQPTHRSAHV